MSKSGGLSGLLRKQGVPVNFGQRGGMGRFGAGSPSRPFGLLKPGLPPLDPNNPGAQRVYGGNTLWDAAQVKPYSLSFPMPASAQRYLDRANGKQGGLAQRAGMIGDTLSDFIMRIRGGY